MLKFIAIITIFISSTAYADEWTRADTYREATYMALHAVDWGQTRNIARNPDKWRELNKGMSSHPTEAEVDQFFIKIAIAHAAIAYALPNEWRSAFQYIYIGEKFGAVVHNFSMGISVKF